MTNENNVEISFSKELQDFIKAIEPTNGKLKIKNEHMFLEALFQMTKKQLSILNAYFYLATQHKTCYPSITTIAKNSGANVRTVKRFLKKYKNIFWLQEERQSQTYLIHIEDWLKQAYLDLSVIIKDIRNIKDRKKYLIKKCYDKNMTLNYLRKGYEQSINKKKHKMSPPKSQNVTQYSSLYSLSNKFKETYISFDSLTENKVHFQIDWGKFDLTKQQKIYFSTYFSKYQIDCAQRELLIQLRCGQAIKSHFGYLYSLLNKDLKKCA